MSESYTMRGLEPTFWRDVKILAAKRGKTVKDLILDMLHKAVWDAEQEPQQAAGTAPGRATARKR